MASFVDDSEKHHAATFVSILRALIGLIGLVAAAGVTALAARHGYVTGATLFDRTVAALTFSIIALTGLVGPAVAWRLCLSSRLKPLGVLLAIISAAALVTNVTHLAAAVDKVATIGANVLPPALVATSPPAAVRHQQRRGGTTAHHSRACCAVLQPNIGGRGCGGTGRIHGS